MSEAKDIMKFAYGTYLYGALWTTKHIQFGTNILTENWDTLIILDACRVDALKYVAPEYDFLEEITSRWSVGSTSKEWLVNTFRTKYSVDNLAMVTGNGWAEVVFEQDPNWGGWGAISVDWWNNSPLTRFIKRDVVRAQDFGLYLPVWEENKRKAGNRAPRAETVTDAAIAAIREDNPEKTLIHYMQPHEPYLHNTEPGEDVTGADANPLDELRNGAHKDEIWNKYLDNLRYVLDSVEILLNNIDSDNVIITADHGELFGEWGVYGHFAALPHPHLRKVPWVKTTANNKETYNSEKPLSAYQSNEGDVEKRLRDLGYV